MIASVTVEAPAKLNLYLHVKGRRDDGYHVLDSLVCFLNVGDRLTLEKAEAYSLHTTGPFGAALAETPARQNLVTRAIYAVAGRLGVAPHVAVTLQKNLPVASGIGGGSSDAAAAMRGDRKSVV